MTTAATISVRLALNADDYNKGLDEAQKKARSFGSSFASAMSGIGGNLASIGKTAAIAIGAAAAATAAGIGKLIQEGVQMDAFLEKSTLQFTTLLGGSADKAKEKVLELFKIAAETPFESEQIIGASKALLTFGGEVLNTKDNLLLIGDAAAATGADIGELSTWVGRSYSAIQSGRPFGEAAMRLQEMGVLSAEARNKIEALQKSGAKSDVIWKELTKTLGKFSGAMKLQAQTWEGLTSTISDNVKLALGKAMKPFFEIFKKGLTKIAEFVSSEKFTAWMEKLGKVVEKVANILNDFVENFIMDMESGINVASSFFYAIGSVFYSAGMQEVAYVFFRIGEAVDELVIAMQNDKGIIIAIVTTLGIAIAAAAWTIIAPMLPLIATFALVAGAVYLLYTAWTQNWGGIQQKTAEAWAFLQPIFTQLVTWLQTNIPIAIQTLLGWRDKLYFAFFFLQALLSLTLGPAIAIMILKWMELQNRMAMFQAWMNAEFIPMLQNLYKLWSELNKLVGIDLPGAFQGLQTVLGAFGMTLDASNPRGLLDTWLQLQKLVGFDLPAAWQGLQTILAIIGDFMRNAFVSSVHAVNVALANTLSFIASLKAALGGIKLPSWMTPGSPTPWQIGLEGVGKAMQQLNRQALPALSANLQLNPVGVSGGANFATPTSNIRTGDPQRDQSSAATATMDSASMRQFADVVARAITSKLAQMG